MRILALATLALLCLATDAFGQVTVVNNRGLLGRRSNVVQVGGGFVAPQRIVVAPQRIVVAPQRLIAPRVIVAPQRLLIAPLRVQNVVAPSNVTVVNNGLRRHRVTVVNSGVAVQQIQQVQQVQQVVHQQQLLVGRRLQLNQLNTYGYTPYNTVQNIQYAPQQLIQVPAYQYVQPVQVVQAAPVVQPAPMVAPAPMKAPDPAPVKAPETTTPLSVVDPCPQQVQQVVQYVQAPQYVVAAPQRQYIAQCR